MGSDKLTKRGLSARKVGGVAFWGAESKRQSNL